MEKLYVGTREDLQKNGRILVRHEDTSLGVFLVREAIIAFENHCAHQGGPVCEGIVVGKVEAELGPQHTIVKEYFSSEHLHLACPWHGYEYDLATGQCAADKKLALRKFAVEEQDGKIYVYL